MAPRLPLSLGTAESLFAQGSGTLSIDVPVEQVPVSGTSEISVSVSARNFVFTVPASGAKVEFFWGSEEHDSKLTAVLLPIRFDT